MADNLGLIIKTEYCFVTDVRSCVVMKNGILINLAGGKGWHDFNASPGKMEIMVEESESNSLPIHTASGTIHSPRFQFERYTDMIQLKARKILLRYTTANGDVMVVGDKENPIKVMVDILNPSNASGFSGVKFTLSGVMKHAELPLL